MSAQWEASTSSPADLRQEWRGRGLLVVLPLQRPLPRRYTHTHTLCQALHTLLPSGGRLCLFLPSFSPLPMLDEGAQVLYCCLLTPLRGFPLRLMCFSLSQSFLGVAHRSTLAGTLALPPAIVLNSHTSADRLHSLIMPFFFLFVALTSFNLAAGA